MYVMGKSLLIGVYLGGFHEKVHTFPYTVLVSDIPVNMLVVPY